MKIVKLETKCFVLPFSEVRENISHDNKTNQINTARNTAYTKT